MKYIEDYFNNLTPEEFDKMLVECDADKLVEKSDSIMKKYINKRVIGIAILSMLYTLNVLIFNAAINNHNIMLSILFGFASITFLVITCKSKIGWQIDNKLDEIDKNKEVL